MYKFILFTFFLLNSVNSKAQTAEDFAKRIAEKMKDSLSLTDDEQSRLYDINMLLHQQKVIAREQYEGNDSLGIKIQNIENTRDSLYREVLHEDRFILYKQKKTALINNN
jgi:hypothetical protein